MSLAKIDVELHPAATASYLKKSLGPGFRQTAVRLRCIKMAFGWLQAAEMARDEDSPNGLTETILARKRLRLDCAAVQIYHCTK